MQNSTNPPRRRKKKKVWPWVILFLAFLAAALAGALFASSSLFDSKDKKADDGLLTAKDKSTIMIMGVDERGKDVGRSDTLMVATIDPKKNQAALLSVPRDTRVKIKGHGFDKINAAYAYGGHELTQNTVENLLGVSMDHYVIINIQAFQRIIDAIGGIDINVEKRMYYSDPYDDNGGLLIDLYPGQQHMDGKTAITYVRYRDTEGDIGRIKRQQNFMKAVMDKVTSPSIIPQLPSIIKEIMNSVKTDLSLRELLEFAGTLKEAQKNGLKTEMVPGRPLYIDGISYWIPDISKLRTTLADTLDVTMDSKVRAAMEQQDSEYENSIPDNATEVPAGDTSIGTLTEDTGTDTTSQQTTRRRDHAKETTPDTTPSEKQSSPPASQPAETPAAQETTPSPAPTPSAGGGSGKTL